MSLPTVILIIVASVVFTALLLRRLSTAATNGLPLPPGPPADTLIGHLRIMPTTNLEAPNVFRKWAHTYGDVVHLRVPRKSLIVLNSHQAATDLLEKRGAIYSGRPPFPLYELIGWTQVLSFLSYGKPFIRHRQALETYLTANNCVKFQEVQTRAARRLTRNILESKTDRFATQIARFSTTVIIQLLAGHEIVSDNDGYLPLAEAVTDTFTRTGPPGNTPVDYLPILRYFPGWFPGAYYAGVARRFRPITRQIFEYPIATVLKEKMAGTAPPSYLLHHLERMDEGTGRLSMEELKGSGATMFSAGKTTTASTLMVFLLAMVLYPAAQEKAHQELDNVIGRSRLPTFSDRENLPYLNALVQEVYRWMPVLPLGLPHKLDADDQYRGWRIPRGSIVFANLRGISKDTAVYRDPEDFRPERFLPAPGGDAEPRFTDAFGYGRRICVGRYFADNSIWIAVATVLATCKIAKKRDDEGNEIEPVWEMSDGLDSHPRNFECAVGPRLDKELLNDLLI